MPPVTQRAAAPAPSAAPATVGAAAYTQGLGDSLAANAPGDQLLAHELAHVVQQPGAAAAAPAGAPTNIRIAPPRPQTQTTGVHAAAPDAPSAAAPQTS